MDHASYWNDQAIEQKKPYWIESVDDRRLLDHLQVETNLQRCFEDGLDYADEELKAVHGSVLDLGAGVCWTTALISRRPRVMQVSAFDYSRHRLFNIAPLVFDQLGARQEIIERRCEPMFPVPWPNEAADFIVWCQALYMNEDPEAILRDARRVLRPGGAIMIACEGINPFSVGMRQWLSRAIRLRHYPPRQWSLLLAGRLADDSGRYEYFGEQYERFVRHAGLEFYRQQLTYPVFPEGQVLAENYFGVKR
jgi:SAM-dependent methyltransferase